MALILTWDGNTTGRTKFTSFENGVSSRWDTYLYKVSDEVITYADISEKFIIGDSNLGNSTVSNLEGADVQDFGSAVFIHCSGSKKWVISGHPGHYVADVYYDNTFTIPESGTYFAGPNSINSAYTNYLEIPSYSVSTITGITMNETLVTLSRGESFQFTLKATYDDGTIEDVTSDASWGLGNDTIEEPVSELNGFTISSSGLLTAIDPTSPSIVVSGKFGGLVAYATVTVYGSSNAYESGGFSGTSFGAGPYDNTFGPDISTGIPAGATGNDVSDSGMYTKYLCNQNYLNLLAQFFWEDNVGIQALKTIFGNPIDSVISLMAYPFDLTTLVATRQQNFFFGKYDSKIPGIAVTKSSLQIDWGTIEIPFYWGNFLDYAPYTQVQLYLPWGVGFVTIDPNEIMPYPNNAGDFNILNYNPGTIRVVTNIELDKGGCVHNVIGNRGLVIGSFGGACGKQIPMTALDQSAKMLALMGAASGVGMAAGNAMANALSGKYTDVTPKYHIGANGQVNRVSFEHSFNAREMGREMGNSRSMRAGLASAAALAHTPPNYPRAGTFSDATNALSIQTPYIIISRPSQSVPTSYGAYNGYPSNIYYNSLSRLSGYTEISEIHLDGVPATLEEITELESLLKGGVLL